jgi:hypothetical protein
MNWRVGLLQTWIILSAIWVIACGVCGYDQFKRSTFLVEDPGGLKFSVRAPSNTAQRDAVAFVQRSDAANAHRENCTTQPSPVCQFPLPLSMPNTIEFWPLLETAGAGPLGSLLVGFLGYWVVPGFRTPHQP